MKNLAGVVAFMIMIMGATPYFGQAQEAAQIRPGAAASCAANCKGIANSNEKNPSSHCCTTGSDEHSLAPAAVGAKSNDHAEALAHAANNPGTPLQMGVSSTFVARDEALYIDELHPSFYGPIRGSGEAYVWFDFRVLENGDEIEQKVHIEEAFVDFNQWAKHFTIRAGKYRLNFGRTNQTHPHDWHFINQGIVLRNFLGPEALFGRGVAVDFHLPGRRDAERLNVSTAVVSEEMEFSEDEELPYKAALGKIKGLVFDGTTANLQIGLNVLKGRYGPSREWNLELWGFELSGEKTLFTQHVLEFQSEVLLNRRELANQTTAETYGYYAQADFLFRRRVQFGLRYDWSQLATAKQQESGFAVLSGFPIGDKTRLRVQLERSTRASGERENKALAQLVFILGTHKHPYPMPKWMH